MENPKIRFKGFTKDWEQRKLGELGSLKNGMNFSKEAMGHGFPFINLQNIFGNNVIDVNKLELADATEKQLLEYSLLKGDVLFVRSSVKLEGVGEAALVPETLENTTYSGFIIRFRDEYGLNNDFKKYIFGTQKVRNQIMAQATNSANKNISQGVLENLTFEVPSFDEQAKIGEHFSNLDHLITLHQRKCEQTKKLKKYMLQKMFPQNGAKVPEIRFDGFTYDWEQRKLSELLEKYEDPVETPHDGYERVGIRSHAKGTFHSFVEPGKELDTAKMYRVAADKFILNITFAWEHAVAITDNNDAGKLVSHRFPQFSFNPKLKPHFFKYLMLDKKFREHLELSSPGGAGRNRVLKISDMLKYEIKLPSIEEQIKIGEYFDSLDHLITLHQRKCDELKKMKKYMLQNMFI